MFISLKEKVQVLEQEAEQVRASFMRQLDALERETTEVLAENHQRQRGMEERASGLADMICHVYIYVYMHICI